MYQHVEARSKQCVMATSQILDLAEKVKIGALPCNPNNGLMKHVICIYTGALKRCDTCCMGVEIGVGGLRRDAP
jgi:hypothetical protein